MSTPIRYTKTSILLLFVFYAAFSADLTQKQRSKLHPLFQTLITNSSQPLAKMSSTSHRIASTISSDGTIRYGAIVYTHDGESLRSMGIHINSNLPDFVTAQVTVQDLTRLASLESVSFLDPGRIHKPLLDISVPETGAKLLHAGFINNTPYKGNGAIVLIYDTGIDWKHFDFRKAGDTTKSRILYIWDQTLTPNSNEHSPSGFNYGVEYTQTQIEGELSGSARGVVREKDIEGHGTHVASIAAGNSQAFNNKYIGMAPEADIIVVKGGDGTFSDLHEINGLTYAQNKATALNEPIVVNMSLGGQLGPHDGTNPDEVAVNSFVTSNSGRVVCISAGNDGANRIHVNGTVGSDSPDSISISVPSYKPYASGAGNNYFVLDVWLQNNKALSATVRSPNNIVFSGQLNNEVYGPNHSDGSIDIYDRNDPQNSHRHLQVYIYDSTSSVPRAGTWTINFNTTEASVAYDAWIDSDLNGPSASLPNGNTNKTVAMPGTSSGAITVGSYTTRSVWYDYHGLGWTYGTTDGAISSFSSIGPTADSRQKPDIAAPGQVIVAALSGNVDTTGSSSDIVVGQKHQTMQGTSMSCPHATGGAALLLSANSSLTAAQIKNYFTSTANADAFAAGLPNYIWGYGKLDIVEAMAKSLWGTASVVRTTLSYDGNGTNDTVRLTGSIKAAIRFSPLVSGTVTGLQLNITTPPNRPIIGNGNLVCEVYTNNAGIPGAKLGTSVNQPLNLLSPGTNNYIQMTSANVSISSGIDYFVVVSVANPSDSVIVRVEKVTNGTHSLLFNGSAWNTQGYNFRLRSIITSTSGLFSTVQDLTLQPTVYHLYQNYPNPFNPTTTITYAIPVKGTVTLQVFDILGRSVATLVKTSQEAGTYHITWNGATNNGIPASSGVYFYRLVSGSFSKTERMLLLK
jgi:minor extracellular serine protease Vpr